MRYFEYILGRTFFSSSDALRAGLQGLGLGNICAGHAIIHPSSSIEVSLYNRPRCVGLRLSDARQRSLNKCSRARRGNRHFETLEACSVMKRFVLFGGEGSGVFWPNVPLKTKGRDNIPVKGRFGLFSETTNTPHMEKFQVELRTPKGQSTAYLAELTVKEHRHEPLDRIAYNREVLAVLPPCRAKRFSAARVDKLRNTRHMNNRNRAT